jgi:hypothetical protein
LINIAYREESVIGGVIEASVQGTATETTVGIDGSHKRDSFVQVRYSANFLELAFQDKNVGKVDCLAQRLRSDEYIDEAVRVKIAPSIMFA